MGTRFAVCLARAPTGGNGGSGALRGQAVGFGDRGGLRGLGWPRGPAAKPHYPLGPPRRAGGFDLPRRARHAPCRLEPAGLSPQPELSLHPAGPGHRAVPPDGVTVCRVGTAPKLRASGSFRGGEPRPFIPSARHHLLAPKAWPTRRIERALSDCLRGKRVWPTAAQFAATGRRRLYDQVVRHSGIACWAQHFGLPILFEVRSREGWTQPRSSRRRQCAERHDRRAPAWTSSGRSRAPGRPMSPRSPPATPTRHPRQRSAAGSCLPSTATSRAPGAAYKRAIASGHAEMAAAAARNLETVLPGRMRRPSSPR
jgi:hypothetical protein